MTLERSAPSGVITSPCGPTLSDERSAGHQGATGHGGLHATFDSTYYYVHTSPDFMGSYADLTGKSRSLLPEVGFE
jgi:hypothetical protein